MLFSSDISIALTISIVIGCPSVVLCADFHRDVKPLLREYCIKCHSGKDANGDVDFSAVKTKDDVDAAFETWESVVGHLHAGTMPPEDEPQPEDKERNRIFVWYEDFVDNIEARPAVFRPRRLSVTEYRNTLQSVLGFDLQVAIIEAEQTVAERSMVIKLLPTDPPGRSGFRNDTHQNPLTTVVWDQYSFLIDSALEQLFSPERRTQLNVFTGTISDNRITIEQAERLLRTFLLRAWRRTVPAADVEQIVSRLQDRNRQELVAALKFEMKTVLMSPAFIYRGLLTSGQHGKRQPVDTFELAERLSYFLWADMPDDQLLFLAADGTLTEPTVYAAQIDRMLMSPKARNLANDFATQWLSLNEIEHVSDNVPQMVALKSQPIDFMHYLFTEDRPLLELIDSETAFISPHTSRMYGADARQLTKYVKQKGIEVEIVPNQKIHLEHTTERGGILTMPGVLAMNKGPIQRGTWVLERILGQALPEPPADVGQVPPNNGAENLTFRQRFEQHRSNPSCAVCHNRIDPLGFALQDFDNGGQYLRSRNYRAPKRRKRDEESADANSEIDTSGRLPSGETFEDIAELRRILTTSQSETVIRNIVERTMSYALCRQLMIHDRPTVNSIVEQMKQDNGTWRDLFHAIANSVPFRETILSADN
ncbi:MAG: DUF1592 domain-containing protein [Fuerstiella sp.]|nr:DUF1592 domain-containing protein [Fuerstiella sp.]MCP4855275.1 DUF1592 domain-containing protein [Fuerstiella sp.]